MKHIYRIALLVLLVIVIVFLYSTLQNEKEEVENIKIITSAYPLYFFTEQIIGNHAEITNIVPSGAEPHDYEPSAQDIALIEKSDLLIINGGGIEPWFEAIKKSISTHVLIAGEFGNRGAQDPHWWLSPRLAKNVAERIESNIVTIDKDNVTSYAENSRALIAKLEELHQDYEKGLTHCTKRDFITAHAAFGYLAEAYHLNQIAISGISPDTEPSPKRLAEIIQFAKSHDIKHIFFENSSNRKIAETLANEINGSVLSLDPIESVSNVAMQSGENYFTKMESNLINLQIALQCTQ